MSSFDRFMYGLLLKTWTLLVAGHVFQEIQPLLQVLDLLLVRKKNDQLIKMEESVVNRTNFSHFPKEVLANIRKQVMKSISMEESAYELLYEDYHCGLDSDYDEASDESGESDGKTGSDTEDRYRNSISKESWTDFLIAGDCEYCNEILVEADGELSYRIKKLLEYYGLEADHSPTYEKGKSYNLNEYYSAISIPISIKSLCNEICEEYPTSTTLLKFSSSAFQIDYGTSNRRLIRLVKDFGLVQYEKSVDGTAETLEKTREIIEVEEEEIETKKLIVPRWFLWNSTHIAYY